MEHLTQCTKTRGNRSYHLTGSPLEACYLTTSNNYSHGYMVDRIMY